jgi:hypothetical protein
MNAGLRPGETIDGRTEDEREQLKREADEDDRRADELLDDGDDHGSYPDYLRKRADWRRYLARE